MARLKSSLLIRNWERTNRNAYFRSAGVIFRHRQEEADEGAGLGRPDVLVVAEALDSWPRRLEVLAEELPFVVRSRIGDVAIYSRYPIAGEPRHLFPNIGHAVVVGVAGLTLIAVDYTTAP